MLKKYFERDVYNGYCMDISKAVTLYEIERITYLCLFNVSLKQKLFRCGILSTSYVQISTSIVFIILSCYNTQPTCHFISNRFFSIARKIFFIILRIKFPAEQKNFEKREENRKSVGLERVTGDTRQACDSSTVLIDM